MEDILDAELLGESDVDEDDIDEAVLLHIFNNDTLGNRADIYGRFSLDTISDIEAKNFFRFEKRHIPRLAIALGIPANITTRENITLPGSGSVALCILLRRLAYPNRLVDLECVFEYSYRAISSIANEVTTFIYNNKSILVQNLRNVPWLNEEKLIQYSEAIAGKGAPLNNWGGGVCRWYCPICRPTENQREYYSGYKKVHCVKYQSLLCPDGIIVNLKGPYPGRQHDSGILRESRLYDELEECTTFGDRKYSIYGDLRIWFKGTSFKALHRARINGAAREATF